MKAEKWISVNDQLPKDHDYVLVTNGKQVTIAEYYVYLQRFVNNDKELKVTFWMPLPKPPHQPRRIQGH